MRAVAMGMAAIAMAAAVAGCDADADTVAVQVSMPEGTTEQEQAMLAPAVEVFLDRCPAILEHWGERYTAFEADRPMEAFPFMEERWGWKRTVALRIRRSDGEVLHFALGGGDQPGILSRKEASSLDCGFPTDGGNDVFVPEERLDVLN